MDKVTMTTAELKATNAQNSTTSLQHNPAKLADQQVGTKLAYFSAEVAVTNVSDGMIILYTK